MGSCLLWPVVLDSRRFLSCSEASLLRWVFLSRAALTSFSIAVACGSKHVFARTTYNDLPEGFEVFDLAVISRGADGRLEMRGLAIGIGAK
jgi:hypothetical protein